MKRRNWIKTIGLTGIFYNINKMLDAKHANLSFETSSELTEKKSFKPIVLSTWHNQGIISNPKAWEILSNNGHALDAVEEAAKMSELDPNNCCVGLGANPDRDGIVTLDACIMNQEHQCGSVLALERIKHPISVARKVMENTPHVVLAGSGAQQFAISQGFPLESTELSEQAQKNYENWLKKSEYRPQINIEKSTIDSNELEKTSPEKASPKKLDGGEFNHDTIGVIAMDSKGNLSGACTTSGMAFKMHGRIGDSPLIGAGLYVDNEVGAATCSGLGEEVIRSCGSFLVVEYMRQGLHPTQACKKAIERIVSKSKLKASDFQVGFIAINKKGEFGGYSINPKFDYTVTNPNMQHEKREAASLKNDFL
jgi:N4-(beta-N-acetylglucosaminyl)-L-asparaginase